MESSMGEKSTKVNELSQAQDVVDRKVIHHEKKNTCTFVKEEKSREEKVKSDENMSHLKEECAMEEKRRMEQESFNKKQGVIDSVSTSLEECECKIHFVSHQFEFPHDEQKVLIFDGFLKALLLGNFHGFQFYHFHFKDFTWLSICGKKRNGSFKVLKVHPCDLVKTAFENARAFAEKDSQEHSIDSPILKYTNPIFKSTSFLEAKEDVQATINRTLSLLDVDSNSSHEEEIDNSALFVPQVLKSHISYYEASSATSSAMPAMMADVSSVEEQIANLTKLVVFPIKIDVKSSTNSFLKNKVEGSSQQSLENFHIMSTVDGGVDSNSEGWRVVK
ncbi:hypothetical protein M9H77_06560 [Catharanthus roseus]|uniref:Uncharacterized protein n=1 Tax=Catharanthus roseus TaxID=4058 RepID=A0ACC0BSF3_CATRO|nr:hypothetical protein M9H77_06560 [Catharanthus roseus]